MAKFRYRMQNILDVKLKLESQAKINYGLAEAAYQEEQKKLQDMLIRRAGYERELKQLMDGSLDLKRLAIARDAVDSLKILIRRQMVEVHKKQRVMEDARNALNQLMQERKMHEKLKEKALEEFKKELLVEENKAIDGLISYTYNGQ